MLEGNIYIYILPFLISFFISLVFTRYILKFALNKKILDDPSSSHRKIHTRPVPLLGGVSVILTFVVAVLIGFLSGWFEYGEYINPQIWGLLAGSLIILIFGYLDDRYNIKPHWQFLGSSLAVLAAILSGIVISYTTNPFTEGTGPYGRGILYFSPFLSYILTFLWIIGVMYVIKLSDGLDGLVAGIGVIGSFILFIVSLFWNKPLSAVSVLALITCGSLLGVLIYNWHPARIFLGESSIFIGYILGVLSIISGAKIATTLLIIGIPLLDIIVVVIWRLLIERKNPFTSSDTKHIHFRLLTLGLTHRQAVLFLYFISALFGASAIFMQSIQKVIALIILGIFMIILAVFSIMSYVKANQ